MLCRAIAPLRREGIPDSAEEEGKRFVLRGGKLLTDAEPAMLEYVRDVDDPALFDDKFVEALSFKLASDLAMPVKGSLELTANYMNVYTTKIAQAAARSAGEEHHPESDNPYLDARFC